MGFPDQQKSWPVPLINQAPLNMERHKWCFITYVIAQYLLLFYEEFKYIKTNKMDDENNINV